MRFSIFFHLLLYPFPIPSQFHMFYFWNPPSLLSVANIGVVASSLNTPNSLSSSHYQLSVALQLEVGPGDPPPPSSTNKPLSGLILYGPCACSVASMSSCCHWHVIAWRHCLSIVSHSFWCLESFPLLFWALGGGNVIGVPPQSLCTLTCCGFLYELPSLQKEGWKVHSSVGEKVSC